MLALEIMACPTGSISAASGVGIGGSPVKLRYMMRCRIRA
jgi:hypothetical protein